jgi:diguanylate cyclase (GGDEF)-like protein
MAIASKKNSALSPLSALLNAESSTSPGLFFVLLGFLISLLFLFSYRILSKGSSRLDLKGHPLTRAVADLETLQTPFRTRTLQGNPSSFAARPGVPDSLRTQSMAGLANLGNPSPDPEDEPSLSGHFVHLHGENPEIRARGPSDPESNVRLAALETRILTGATRAYPRISLLKLDNDRFRSKIRHREKGLLTFSFIILGLGSLLSLTLFVLALVLGRNKQKTVRREDLLNGLLSSTTNGIILKDLEGKWIDLSPRVSSLLNLSDNPSDILGKTDEDIVALYPHIAPFVAENHLLDPLTLLRRTSFQSTVSLPGTESLSRHILIDRAPFFSRQKEILGTITTIIDMTDRIILEDLQKALAHIASIGLEIHDPQEFLVQVCRILADHSDFLLVWTTKLPDPPGSERGGGLHLENFMSRGPRFLPPASLPVDIGGTGSDLLADNGQTIDSWVFENGQPRIDSDLTLSLFSGKFPFFAPDPRENSGPFPLTMAVYPLFQEGRVSGTLGVLSRGHRSLSPQVEEILSRLSVSITLALENFHSSLGRRQAEKRSLLLKNYYDALSKVATLLLSLPPPEILLDSVCRILAETGNASTCWIRMENFDRGSVALPYHAGCLDDSRMLLLERMANAPETLASQGFSREALRTRKPMVLNDLNLSAGTWKPSRFLLDQDIFSLCSLPISEREESTLALVVGGDRPGYFTPELITLLSRLAENISFGIDNYGRELHRQQNTKKTERLKNIYQALSDTNEILLTHRNPDSVFETLCRTIIFYSHAHTAGIYLLNKESQTCKLVAWDGPTPDTMPTLTPSADDAFPDGKEVFGMAIRSGTSQTLNLEDLRSMTTPALRLLFEQLDVRSTGVFPIRRGGEVFGLLLLTSTEAFFFDEELRRLIDRMVLNISFSLDLFDREETRKERENTILHQSLHDMLTGLPNRLHFSRKIEEAIFHSAQTGLSFGVGIIDIDNFKEINDRLGHKTGDSLLKEVAKRLQESLRPIDVLARLGGDEFGILVRDLNLPHLPGEDSRDPSPLLSSLLQSLINSMDSPFHVGDETIPGVSMSIGVALFPDQGNSAEVLMKRSDLALYDSKNRQGGVWTLFSSDLETRLERTFMIRSDFDRALESDEILLYAQPQTSLETGLPNGIEVLVRWNHPRKGLLTPGAFIQEVENSPSLIRKLGLSILERSLAQAALWREMGLDVPVAVNIGARHFLDPHFTEDVSRILLAHSNVPPSSLQIEITESATLSDFKTVQSILTHLRSIGVEVALDDFGTGHASLSYLQKIPADTIKMDLQFVRDILVDPKDLAIVAGTLTTARLLKLKTVAEGVETPQHAVVLMKLGCRAGQGYGIAPPMPAKDVVGWLRDFSPDPLMSEWSDRPWSRRNIQNLAIYMEHHRRSEELYYRIRREAGGSVPGEKSPREPECPLSLWVKGKGSQLFEGSPLFLELVDLHHAAHGLARNMESLLRNRRAADALPMISEHMELNEGLLRAMEDLGPEEVS